MLNFVEPNSYMYNYQCEITATELRGLYDDLHKMLETEYYDFYTKSRNAGDLVWAPEVTHSSSGVAYLQQ